MSCFLCHFSETIGNVEFESEIVPLCEDCLDSFNNNAEWIENLE